MIWAEREMRWQDPTQIHEMIVFHNGIPIYKRWRSNTHGIVIDSFGPPWSVQDHLCYQDRITRPTKEEPNA